MRGQHLHFDLPSGIAGDMALGALLDLGVPLSAVTSVLDRLALSTYRLSVEKTKRGGLVGTDVKVIEDNVNDDHHHHHRHYADIKSMIADADLDKEVHALAIAIFDKIAEAESKMHGVPVAEVAFHEVGAVDSIVDVVGVAAALSWLAPTSVSSSAVPLGRGAVKSAHGLLPVPAPATLEILRAASVPTVDGGVDGELCTPTGAAILATVVTTWGAMPGLSVDAVGYGAGDKELADRPNLVRAVVGKTKPGDTAVRLVQLDANIDDMNPELCGYVVETLFAAGVLDAWWTPIIMKKSRPALLLSVLVEPSMVTKAEDIVLRETTTLGIRRHDVTRRHLQRHTEAVDTAYGEVQIKIGQADDEVMNVAPEYESCRLAATRGDVALKEVYAAAMSAYWQAHKTKSRS